MLQGLPSKFSVTLCAGAAITLTAGRERISWVATLSSTSLSQVSQPVPTSHRFQSNGTEDFLILASANIPSSLEGEEQEWVWRRITWSRSPPHPPLSPGLTACPPGGRPAHESSSHIAPLTELPPAAAHHLPAKHPLPNTEGRCYNSHTWLSRHLLAELLLLVRDLSTLAGMWMNCKPRSVC